MGKIPVVLQFSDEWRLHIVADALKMRFTEVISYYMSDNMSHRHVPCQLSVNSQTMYQG